MDEFMNKVERTDAFEEKYNFRFEDDAASSGPLSGASHINVRYARGISGDTLRRKYNSKSHKRTARK